MVLGLIGMLDFPANHHDVGVMAIALALGFEGLGGIRAVERRLGPRGA